MAEHPLRRFIPGRVTKLPTVPLRPRIPDLIKRRRNDELLAAWNEYERLDETWRQQLNQMLSELAAAAATTTTVTDEDSGAGSGGGDVTVVSGAPVDATYLLMSPNASLLNARVLQALAPLVLTDNLTTATLSLSGIGRLGEYHVLLACSEAEVAIP